MRRKKKKSMYVALLALVLMISIGYAFLSANLKINGTSRINDVTWDVHFENAEATENSTVTPTTAPSAPAASKLQEISYDVTFDTPGQIYEFTVDVKNGGSIDAMIESFTSKIKIGDGTEQDVSSSTLPSYLDYAVTYEDGTAIADNHELKHGTSEKIKVHVEFKRDITNTELQEASGKTIKFTLELNYKQADGTKTSVHSTFTGNVYRHSTQEVLIGNSITPINGTKWIIKLNGEEGPYYYDTHSECTTTLSDWGVTEDVEDEDGYKYTCEEKTGTFDVNPI